MLASFTNAPWSLTVGGREVMAAPLPLRQFGVLERWLQQHVPRPTDAAKARMAGLEKELRDEIWREAVRADMAWPPDPASTEAQTIFSRDPDGIVFFLKTCLCSLNKTLSDVDIEEIADKVTPEEMYLLRRVAFGDSELDLKALAAAYKEASRQAYAAELAALTGAASSMRSLQETVLTDDPSPKSPS